MRASFRPAADVLAAVFTGHKRPLETPFPVHVVFRFRGSDDKPSAALMTPQCPGHNRRVFNVLGCVARGAPIFHFFHPSSPFSSYSATLLSPLSDEKFILDTFLPLLKIGKVLLINHWRLILSPNV